MTPPWPLRNYALVLAASTALGVAAWFLPDALRVWAAVGALALAVLAIVDALDMVRMLTEWLTRDRTRAIHIELGGDSLELGSVPREEQAALIEAFLAKLDERLGHLPSAADVERGQARTRESLVTAIDVLTGEMNALRDQLRAEEIRARRSSILSFWGRVAISIPIGVLINIATG
ncbi:hypothetical protein HH310_27015 [Actinoplanes sp. TBRC 11911]|uniref:hypothetical protein n=1 Tax=Actinoplanes sp. TBRC 11911 TaxID=2729386 RepID=UPI00145D4F6A|nr:hypothetical protein [Actinoplanes sp. TBRC 11911]NMO54823.1 hypothetical protein [Actinoplanes sp. TBRC 11911]